MSESPDLRISITMSTRLPPTESDFVIVVIPPGTEITPSSAMRMLTMATKACLTGGQILHHADWVVTRDPELVGAHGGDHCDTCAAHRREASAYLELDPEHRVALGTLFYRPDPARN